MLAASAPAQTPAATASPVDPAGAAAPKTAAAPKITYSEVNVDGPYIAMTFDDGPHATNTPRLLDLAAKKLIKLTFFLIGENAAANPALVKREIAEGHEVCNHSLTHPDFAKMPEAAVRNQLQKTQDIITQAGGVTPTLMRPPYGDFTAKQRQWAHAEFGFKIILWDVDPLDWKDRNSATVARRILAGVRPGSIILSHDIHATTIAAMPEVFDTLLARGYKFVTVSELIAMDKGGPRPELKKGSAVNKKTPDVPAASPSAAASPVANAAR